MGMTCKHVRGDAIWAEKQTHLVEMPPPTHMSVALQARTGRQALHTCVGCAHVFRG